MTDLEGMLDRHFRTAIRKDLFKVKEEDPIWEKVFDDFGGRDVFTWFEVFKDAEQFDPTPIEVEFKPGKMDMEQLVTAKYSGEHTEEELARIDNMIDIKTSRISAELPRYEESADGDYLNTINDFLYKIQGVKK